ncbi:MAG: hypothetical protein V1898_02510 [Patescibacteria group bacterium]
MRKHKIILTLICILFTIVIAGLLYVYNSFYKALEGSLAITPFEVINKDKTGRFIALKIEGRAYGCSSSRINYKLDQKDDVFTIKLKNVSTNSIFCDMATPSVAIIELPGKIGIYTINLKHQNIIDKYKIEISDSEFFVLASDTTLSSFTVDKIDRYPQNSFVATCRRYYGLEYDPVCESFFQELEANGAKLSDSSYSEQLQDDSKLFLYERDINDFADILNNLDDKNHFFELVDQNGESLKMDYFKCYGPRNTDPEAYSIKDKQLVLTDLKLLNLAIKIPQDWQALDRIEGDGGLTHKRAQGGAILVTDKCNEVHIFLLNESFDEYFSKTSDRVDINTEAVTINNKTWYKVVTTKKADSKSKLSIKTTVIVLPMEDNLLYIDISLADNWEDIIDLAKQIDFLEHNVY